MSEAKDYNHVLARMQRVLEKYPAAWDQARKFRRQQGKGIPAWPAWCFLPISGSYFIVSEGRHPINPNAVSNIGPVAAALAWWPTKAVFHFDKPLLDVLIDQHQPEDVPVGQLLNQLPKWGGYVDLSNTDKLNAEGFWWHLEASANHQNRPELHILVYQYDGSFLPLPLILGTDPQQGVRDVLQAALQTADKRGVSIPIMVGAVSGIVDMIAPLLNILLYMSSTQAQFDPPINPAPSTMPEARPVLVRVS